MVSKVIVAYQELSNFKLPHRVTQNDVRILLHGRMRYMSFNMRAELMRFLSPAILLKAITTLKNEKQP